MLSYACNALYLAVFLCCLPTSLSTLLAMLNLVFLTFSGTGFADIDAGANNLRNEARATAHVGSRSPAHLSTIDAKPSAFCHTTQALVSTMFAFIGTVGSNIDTRLSYLMWQRRLS